MIKGLIDRLVEKYNAKLDARFSDKARETEKILADFKNESERAVKEFYEAIKKLRVQVAEYNSLATDIDKVRSLIKERWGFIHQNEFNIRMTAMSGRIESIALKVIDRIERVERTIALVENIRKADPQGSRVKSIEQTLDYLVQISPIQLFRVDDLELPIRAYNALKKGGIVTTPQLLSCTEAELLKLPDFGRKSLNEVKETLKNFNLKLRNPHD